MVDNIPKILKPDSPCVSILNEAAEHVHRREFKQSLQAFYQGIEMLLAARKEEDDPHFKSILHEKAEYYLNFAEKVKLIIEEDKSLVNNRHRTISIKNDETGHGYNTLIGPYCDQNVTEVRVEDPYIRQHHQLNNFVHLIEMFFKRCPNLKTINLVTACSSDNMQTQLQKKAISEIALSLTEKSIKLNVEFSTVLHDRQIRLNNGWVIKIGRGLDYFKKLKYKYGLGLYDQDHRQCQETNVDIFYVGR